MLDWTLITLTLLAMIADIIAVVFLFSILKRTRGRIRLSFILLIFVAIFFFIRRAVYLLNIVVEINSLQYVDTILSVILALFLLLTVINIFKSIREVTDVEVGRREEHSPQSRQRYFDKEERPQFQQRPQERIQEKPPQDQSRPQRETRRLRVVNGYVDFTKDGSI